MDTSFSDYWNYMSIMGPKEPRPEGGVVDVDGDLVLDDVADTQVDSDTGTKAKLARLACVEKEYWHTGTIT